MFWDQLATLGVWGIIIEVVLIIFFKIIEVSIGTVRSILVVKGYRQFAAILAIFEILLWVFLASRVITGLAEDPLKGIAYSIGFAAGVYFGSFIEQKLAFGMLNVQIITNIENYQEIATALREDGFGVTTLDAKGRNEKRKILMVLANRYGSEKITARVKAINEEAVIVFNDINSLSGGYIRKRRQIRK